MYVFETTSGSKTNRHVGLGMSTGRPKKMSHPDALLQYWVCHQNRLPLGRVTTCDHWISYSAIMIGEFLLEVCTFVVL